MMLRKIMSRREGEICKWRCRLIILCLYLILVIYFLSIFRGRQIWRFSSETPLIFVAALHISSPSSLSSSFPFPSSYSPSSSPNLFSFVPSSVSSLSTFPNPINPINFRALSLKSRSSKIMSPQDSAPSSHYSSLLDRGGGGGGGGFQRKFTSRKKNPPSPPSLRMMMKMSAVVEGEKVNGKSVKDWTVDRTLYQALHMATAEELKRDPTVCVIGEDVGHYGGSYKVTKDLHYLHGNFRVMDTPICENTFTGMAIGAAMNGLRPIVEGMNMGFLLLAFNQISNNAGMVKYTSGGNFDVPLVIRGPGGIGKQLGPEHSQRIEAYFQAVPGLKLVACSTPRNARGLLKSAIRENNPVLFFEHVLLYNLKESIPFLPYSTPLDKAEIARPGKDITILSYSLMRHVALEAAEKLAKEFGVDAEVVDLISLKPLDLSTIKRSIQKTHRCLILDESSKTGGIGGEIYAQVIENCSHDLDEIPVRLCTKDVPTPYNRLLEKATIVSPADVVNTVVWMQSARKEELKFNSELMMKTTTTT